MSSDDKNGSSGAIGAIGVLVFAGVCIILALVLPWAEIGLPATASAATFEFGPWNVSLGPLVDLCKSISSTAGGLLKAGQNDPNFNFYVYSCFLGLAMTAAAIGLHLVGREESEEKTILPVKK
jgi:hypothetical protein